MSLWTWFDRGGTLPKRDTFRERVMYAWGRRRAMARGRVEAHPSCLIHPEARLSPRAGRIRIGARSTVAPGAIVQGAVEIGEDSSVQSYAVIVGYGSGAQPEGAVTIGHHVRIAPHVMIIAQQHRFEDPARPIHHQGGRPAPVVIEDDVWIGGGAHIMAGVRIGAHSVIGAGAVVTKDLPAYSVAAGVPARVIRDRTPQGEGER